jgi:predicted Zn finger-like uncharacterized protein
MQIPHDPLEPLVTECPHCRTRFRVSDAQLQRAHGRVRCGACLHVFDGIDRLTPESVRWQADPQQVRPGRDALLEELGKTAPLFGGFEDAEPAPDDPAAPPARPLVFQLHDGAEAAGAADPMPSVTVPAVSADTTSFSSPAATAVAPVDPPPAPAPSSASAVTGTVTPSAAPEPLTVAVPKLDPAKTQPSAERLAFGEPRARHPWLWAGIPILSLLLAGQVLWYQFDDWSKQPQWRGVYEVACRALGCELPLRRDASLLNTRNMAVRSDPERPGLLLVNAVIVNEADFPQPFPLLELRFNTLRGILVAGRRYHPEDYLSGDAFGLQLIPPKTPVQVELSIDDPGPEAVNYSLHLR